MRVLLRFVLQGDELRSDQKTNEIDCAISLSLQHTEDITQLSPYHTEGTSPELCLTWETRTGESCEGGRTLLGTLLSIGPLSLF